MLLPDGNPNKISDPSELQQYVVAAGQGGRGISPQDYTQMKSWFDKTPQGQALTANRKSVMDMAKSTLIQKSGNMGAADPIGQHALMQFTNYMQSQEQNAISQRQPVADLYNVNSKNFIGNQIKAFLPTPEERNNQLFGAYGQQAQGDQGGNGNPPPPEPRVKVLSPKGERLTIPKSQIGMLPKGFKLNE